MDFSVLPPEVTSTLMYSGPGSSSMVAAASAWNAIAGELSSASRGYTAVLSQLASEEWMGPASGSMVEAAQPYVDWVAESAALAEQTGTQAMSAAASFEAAFASIVPPPLVAANRSELAEVLQSNLFGTYDHLVVELQAEYEEMWAHNSSVMFNYAASSAQSTKMKAFPPSPTVTNPAGSSAQAAAANSAAGNSANSLQSFLDQIQAELTKLSNNFNSALWGAEKPILERLWFLVTGQSVLPSNMGAFLNGVSPYSSWFYSTEGLPYFSVGMGNMGVQMAKTGGLLNAVTPAAAAAIPKPPISAAVGGLGGQVSVGLGARHIGHLSVPASFPGASVAAAPPPAVVAVSEPITVAESGAGNVMGGLPVGAGGAGRGSAAGPRYGFKPTVVARPFAAG